MVYIHPAPPKIAELVKIAEGRTVRVEYCLGYRPGGIFVIIDYRGNERLIRRIPEAKTECTIPWGEYGIAS